MKIMTAAVKFGQKVKEKASIKMMAISGAAVAALGGASSASAATAPAVVPDFSGVDVGFTPGDLLTGSTGFYTLFIGFIVLVLAIKLAPSLIGFLFGIIGKLRGGKA
jgi:hypothetical protein